MKQFIITLAISLIGLFVFAPAASAVTVVDCEGAGISGNDCKTVNENDLDYSAQKNIVWTIIQFVLGVLGGIAVIMIVIGGIKYTTSNGDSNSLQSAKNTILYSVVGLVVAMSASAIVLLVQNFFLK